MYSEYDPLPKPEEEESPPEGSGETGVITVEDYYDMLMEHQEQM